MERPTGARILASPLAKRIAANKGIDLKALKGSGPHGRIIRRDVEIQSAVPTNSIPIFPAVGALAVSSFGCPILSWKSLMLTLLPCSNVT